MGGGSIRPIAAQGVWAPPIGSPGGGFGGLPIPPIPPVGVSIGDEQTADHHSDLTEIPPDGGSTPPETDPDLAPSSQAGLPIEVPQLIQLHPVVDDDDDPHWAPRTA